jgi:hypothetical protein
MYGKVERTETAHIVATEDEINELFDYLSAWSERGRELLPEKMPQVFHNLCVTLGHLIEEI